MCKNRCQKNKIKVFVIKWEFEILRLNNAVWIIMFIVNITVEKMKVFKFWSNLVFTPINSLFNYIYTPIFSFNRQVAGKRNCHTPHSGSYIQNPFIRFQISDIQKIVFKFK